MTEERVQPEGYKIEECNIQSTGQCAMHGIEIERRKSTQKELTELKATLEKTDGYVANLLTNQNRFIGIGTIAFVILSGSYGLTWDHIYSARAKYREISVEISKLETEKHQQDVEISGMREQMARSDERGKGIDNRLSSIDSRLAQMVGLLLKQGDITGEELLRLNR